MALNTATATKTVTGYFTKRMNVEDAIDSLKEAGFMPPQISLAIRPQYVSDENGDFSATIEAGQKAESMWRKVVGFFQEKCETDLYSRDGKHAELSSVVVGQSVQGGHGYDYNDSCESISKFNVPEEHARYFSHHFSQGEEGALVTVSVAGRAAEAKAILKLHDGHTGEAAIEFTYPAKDEASSADEGRQRV